MTSKQPPKLATWLLSHFGCSPNNDAVLGDLVERYQCMPKSMWYWQQVLTAILISFFQEIWEHKLLAVRALFVGWGMKIIWLSLGRYEFSRPGSWILHTYVSPQLLPVLLSLTVVACAGSTWLVARVSGSNKRPIVLLYLAMEMTAMPIVLRIGGVSSWSFFTIWPNQGIEFSSWLTAFTGPVNQSLMHLGYAVPHYPITNPAHLQNNAATWCASALMAVTILFGGGLFRAPDRSEVARKNLFVLFYSSFADPQTQTTRGRIEGIVLQVGVALSQPVVGARITVTKVNSANGTNLPIPGRVAGTSVTIDVGGNIPVPGMLQGGQSGTPPPTPPVQAPPSQTALPIPSVTTERNGRFVVPNLEEGSYRILITQNGYVRQEYGQRVFPGQGTLINLAAGQVLKDITIHLTATGNVSGRIMDNDSQPASGVPMQLLKAIYSSAGQRIFQSAGQARTNDRGEYRFYWVTPGIYYVVGGSSSAARFFGSNTSNSPNEPGDNYSFTYYPGVTDIDHATPVDVKPGSELVLDFVAPRQQLYTISGKIVDRNPPTNAIGNLPAVTLSLAFQTLTGQSGAFTMDQAYDPATGNFVLRDVVPGVYVLQAAAPPSVARLPLVVTNNDIEGLAIDVDSGININGRFMAEDGVMPNPASLRVQMRLVTDGVQSLVGAIPSAQAFGTDGSFSFASVLPGQYRVVVPPSLDFYVKQLFYDHADALNNPVEILHRNSDSGTMEVVISRSVGQVDGLIVDDHMQAVLGVQAVLIPDGAKRTRSELYRTATTDQTGHFTMRGVAPGDYKLFAWEGMENYGYFDSDVMRRSESFGKSVHVTENSKLSVEIKIIPVGQ